MQTGKGHFPGVSRMDQNGNDKIGARYGVGLEQVWWGILISARCFWAGFILISVDRIGDRNCVINTGNRGRENSAFRNIYKKVTVPDGPRRPSVYFFSSVFASSFFSSFASLRPLTAFTATTFPSNPIVSSWLNWMCLAQAPSLGSNVTRPLFFYSYGLFLPENIPVSVLLSIKT